MTIWLSYSHQYRWEDLTLQTYQPRACLSKIAMYEVYQVVIL
jgi:hypothetical protein